ncbi:General stress protein 26 [Polynucleobacter meluiroseus]|uniref:General stress protein 26 n=1 Tax=Polynucleobacter meluiroseus TaxID=1938814 RepID=A0A240DYN6_9BURK|nr:pyridoxamine 5'-phosphate oxidase family protein [Polynucleobacter meluiroseus]SNX28042.1 General stress protein 26 [Polynucleobacter meluiroseus]
MKKNKDVHNLHEVVNEFEAAMLVTHDASKIHARPMVIARLDEKMGVYLITDIHSVKVDEMKVNPHALLTFQSSSQFATVSGDLLMVQDRTLIESMWKEVWQVWFPLGKTDPNITLLQFTAHEGDFWDNAGMKGLKYVYSAAKAYVSGETPVPNKELHAKVNL